jgi:hypothetical protein
VYKEDNKDDDDRIIMNTPIYVLISAVVAVLIFLGYQQWIYQPIDLQALAQQIDRELPIPHQTAQYQLDPVEVSADQQQLIVKQHLRTEQGMLIPAALAQQTNKTFQQVFCQVVVAQVGLVSQMQKEQKVFLIKYYNAKGLILETVTLRPQQCLA